MMKTGISMPRRRMTSGFSLVEVLIAAVIILFIALGIIPLFTSAMSSNLSGQSSTESANLVRSRLEEFWQMPIDAPELTINAGNERIYYEILDEEGSGDWVVVASPPSPPPAGTDWVRTTTIRQYSADDLGTPLDASASPATIHIKELVVQVASARVAGPLGAGKSLAIRAYKGL